jgi:hypothetical protein
MVVGTAQAAVMLGAVKLALAVLVQQLLAVLAVLTAALVVQAV